MRFPRGRRRLAIVVAALLATAAVAVIVHRVLAPAEVSTVARADYPAPARPAAGVIGRLPVAPLIVDGRLRVYAAHRQVYADRPVDGRYRTSPYWSYRRWPAELTGVVASGSTVVSRWSDGQLVALDARTGGVLWRADGPEPVESTAPVRRTWAATVWDAPGLQLTDLPDGRVVLVVTGDAQARGVELSGGRELWRVELPGGRCRSDVGTSATGLLIGLDTCAGAATVEFRDAATGEVRERWRPPGGPDGFVVTPLGCRTGGSDCLGLRTAGPGDEGGQGWLLTAGSPVAAPALDPAGAALVGEQSVAVLDGVVVGRSARTGGELWRSAGLGAARVLAGQPGRVHLLTEANDLVTLDPVTGRQLSRFALNVGSDGTGWAPGAVTAEDGFVAIERLRRPVDPTGDDRRYYYTGETVILAAT